MSSDKETKGITAVLIIEILGRPPEHLRLALEKLSKDIDAEKGVTVLKKKIHDAKPVEAQKEFFTTFMEVEVEVDEVLNLVVLMFKYMPSHLEIIEPELIALTNGGWGEILSELSRRLHGYDEVARVLQLQNEDLQKKLSEAINANQNKSVKEDKKDAKKKTSKKPKK